MLHPSRGASVQMIAGDREVKTPHFLPINFICTGAVRPYGTDDDGGNHTACRLITDTVADGGQ
jgi:hypothetical protein